MANFIKIRIKKEEFWMLKISNHEEIMDYMKFFAGRAWEGAKMCVSRIIEIGEISHLSDNPEAQLMKVIAECSADEKGNYEFHPMKQSSNLIGMKLKLLMDMVGDDKEVIINENGGCCDLESFLNIHNGMVLEEMVSDKIIFPKKVDKSKTYRLVILENSDELDYDYRKLTKYSDDFICLNKLKTRTKEEIIFHLMNCEQIMIKTTFLDNEQAIIFLKLFSKINNKRIKIISDRVIDFIQKMTQDNSLNELYKTVVTNNKVDFYNSLLEKINL